MSTPVVHVVRRVLPGTAPAERSPASAPAPARKLSHLLLIGVPLPPAQRAALAEHFATIEHYPERGGIPPDAYARADAVFGFPQIAEFADAPRLRLVHTASAGADFLLKNPIWKKEGAKRGILMATCAGVHMQPISQYFIMTTLALFHHLQEQVVIAQVEKRWGSDVEVGGSGLFVQELRGKTVGVLGYGHIGRECARLAAAFGAHVVVANSDGRKKSQTGYHEPGMGDPDGSIPEAWYSSRSEESFDAFLARADVLLLALPSSPGTRHILSTRTLAQLPAHAVVVNVGRGDAVDTDALLAALDARALGGAALDVAENEPLPAGHPLFGRRDVLITPHLSGRTVVYYERAFGVLLENVRRFERGEELWNLVDYQKGY